MTTNKPKVVAYRSLDGHLINSTTHPEFYDALVLLSDYEALQAMFEKLRKHLQNLIDQTTPLEPEPGNPMWSRRIQLDEVIAERDQLQAECEKLRKDVDRYRPLPETAQGEPVAWLPYLTDRADGVTGHYAIARKNPAGYREVWNLRSHRWAAFSDEVLTLDEALALLKKLEMPTAPQPSFQLPEFATDPDDSDEGASLWDHGFKQGWNSCLEAVAEDMQHTEQRKILDAEVTAESLVPLSDYQKLQDKCGVLVKDLELLLRRLEKMPRKLWLKEQLETILTTLAFEDEKESSHDNQ